LIEPVHRHTGTPAAGDPVAGIPVAGIPIIRWRSDRHSASPLNRYL